MTKSTGKPTIPQIKLRCTELALEYGLSPALLIRQCEAESSFNPRAKSTCGALGLMQLMPETAAELHVDPLDWEENLEGGARYMQRLVRTYGAHDKALAAYNWGPGNLNKCLRNFPRDWKDHLPAETANYLKRILG